MKKVVLKLDLHDDKVKQKAMRTVATIPGIDSISMDMKEQKMTVIGAIDPVDVVSKLRKQWRAEIFSVGPAKEPEKKDEAKKDEAKKDDIDKEEDGKKDSDEKVISDLVKAYQSYNPHMTTHYYVQSAEENPNSCVIC